MSVKRLFGLDISMLLIVLKNVFHTTYNIISARIFFNLYISKYIFIFEITAIIFVIGSKFVCLSYDLREYAEMLFSVIYYYRYCGDLHY